MIKNIKFKHLIIALAILLVILRLLYIFVPFDRDDGAYAYIGWLWFTGRGIPYLSVFDPKLPLVYVLYGIGVLITPNNFIGPRIVAFFYEFAILGVFYWFAKDVTKNKLLSFLVTLLVGFFYASIRLEGSQFNTEIQMVLPMLIFTFLLWKEAEKESSSKRMLFLTGIVGGVTLLFKTAGAPTLGALMLWYLIYKKDLRGIIVLGIGCLIPLGLTVLYFYHQHALYEVYQDVYLYNQDYTKQGLRLTDIYIRGGHTGILGILSWFFLDIPRVLIWFILFSLGSLVYFYKKRSSLWWICVILFCGLWIGIKLGGREFPHYYLFLPFVLGLASLLIFEKMLNTISKEIVSIIIFVFIALIIIPEMFFIVQGPSVILYQEFGGQNAWFYDAVSVGKYIHTHYPKASLLEWASEPEICYYAGKQCISKYVNAYGFYYFKQDQIQWFKDIRKNPPPLIITYENDSSSHIDVAKFLKDKAIYKKVFKSQSYLIFERFKK